MIPSTLSLWRIAEVWTEDPSVPLSFNEVLIILMRAFWSGDFETNDGSSVVFWADEDWSQIQDAGHSHLEMRDRGGVPALERVTSIAWVGAPVTRAELVRSFVLAGLAPSIHVDVLDLHVRDQLYGLPEFEEACRQFASVGFADWPMAALAYFRNIAVAKRDFVQWCEANNHTPPSFWGGTLTPTPQGVPGSDVNGSDVGLGPTKGWTEESLQNDYLKLVSVHRDRAATINALHARDYKPRRLTGTSKVSIDTLRRLTRKL